MRAQIYKYLLYTTRKNSFFDKYITYIYLITTFTADAKNFRFIKQIYRELNEFMLNPNIVQWA